VGGSKQAIRIYSDACRGLYTLANSGQSKYGGWSIQGFEQYNELKTTLAQQGRDNPNYHHPCHSASSSTKMHRKHKPFE